MDEEEKQKMKSRTKIIVASITAVCSLASALAGMIYASNNPNVQNVFNYNNSYGAEQEGQAVTTIGTSVLPVTTTLAQSEPIWLDTLGYEGFKANFSESTVSSCGKFRKGDDLFERGVKVTTCIPTNYTENKGEKIELNYNLNSQYQRFDCTVVITNGSTWFKPTIFSVYCDNNLVFKSPGLTVDSPNIQVNELNISGCNTLTFKFDSPLNEKYSNSSLDIYLADAKLY